MELCAGRGPLPVCIDCAEDGALVSWSPSCPRGCDSEKGRDGAQGWKKKKQTPFGLGWAGPPNPKAKTPNVSWSRFGEQNKGRNGHEARAHFHSGELREGLLPWAAPPPPPMDCP